MLTSAKKLWSWWRRGIVQRWFAPGPRPLDEAVAWTAIMGATTLLILFSSCDERVERHPGAPGVTTTTVVADTTGAGVRALMVESLAAALADAPADTVPPMLSIVSWLAVWYPDATLIRHPPLAFSASAPTVGTTPVRYEWQYLVGQPEPAFPPELVEAVGYRVDCTLYVADRVDTVACRVRAIDAAGVAGLWSEWSESYPVDP